MNEENFEDEWDFDDHPDLPPEAGQMTAKGYEPDDEWLKRADPRLAHEAMRRWFLTRFQDPSNDTPYNGAEGGYLYIHGGPFSAEDELYGRFSDVIADPDEYIRRVIDDVEQEGTYEWAPTHREREDEYDERFDLKIEVQNEPLRRLQARIQQSRQVLTLQGHVAARALAERLVYASVIGAAEAYLYEVAYFWIDTDEEVLRNVVMNLPAYQQEKIPLSSLFAEMSGLKKRVKGRLQSMVWHRWKDVAQLYLAGLRIRLPSVKALEDALQKRHDIVHRSGHDKDGNMVDVAPGEIEQLMIAVEAFATELEEKIATRPKQGSSGGINAAEADAPAPPPAGAKSAK